MADTRDEAMDHVDATADLLARAKAVSSQCPGRVMDCEDIGERRCAELRGSQICLRAGWVTAEVEW